MTASTGNWKPWNAPLLNEAFRSHRASRTDLDQINNYLVEKAGPMIARRVMKEFRSALYLLGGQRGIGHVREDLTSRPVKFWPIYSYLIVYDPETRPVEIVRVLHAMREIEGILK